MRDVVAAIRQWLFMGHFVHLLKKYSSRSDERPRVLELGCGTGTLLRMLESRFETFGIDISEQAITMAKQVTQAAKLYQRDASDLSIFGDAFFDVVISNHMFEHLDSRSIVNALRETNRVLIPGGVFVMVTPNLASPFIKTRGVEWYGFRDKSHISLRTVEGWVESIRSQDFDVAEVYGGRIWDKPLKHVPAPVQAVLIKAPINVLFSSGLIRLPAKYGDEIIIVAKKP